MRGKLLNTTNLRSFQTARERRDYLSRNLNKDFTAIADFNFSEESVSGKNIENLIGAVQIPLGVAGPLRLSGDTKDYFIPLATTEGALVASLSRGLKAAYENGITVTVESVGVTRGPVFKTTGIEHSRKILLWIDKHFPTLQKKAASTSSHLTLSRYFSTTVGKNLYIRFVFDTDAAMGMNMATFATEQIAMAVEEATGAKCISLAGNFDIDKKPGWLNFIEGRGKKVSAELVISRKVLKNVLKVTPQQLVDLVQRKCHLGSAAAGSLGFNAHYANIVAAIFLATGQDIAQVVEGSMGITTAEVTDTGDLYFSVYLPALMAGVVGGGTTLPAQNEALVLMGINGSSDILKYCRLVGAAVLAGELSLLASQAEGSLARAHKKLGRNQK